MKTTPTALLKVFHLATSVEAAAFFSICATDAVADEGPAALVRDAEPGSWRVEVLVNVENFEWVEDRTSVVEVSAVEDLVVEASAVKGVGN